MYAINIGHQNSQKCDSCQSKLIEYVGTQAWCLNCRKAIKTIEQQIKVVPKMYRSNCKDKQSSAQTKIKIYLSEFCNKFGGISDNEEILFLCNQALQLRNKKGITTKNYRQHAAVVTFAYFKDIHKLSIKQFCKKNQVQQKSFNKSYFLYQRILKEKSSVSQQINKKKQEDNLKREEKMKYEETNEEQSKNNGSLFQDQSLNYVQHNERQEYFRELKPPLSPDAESQLFGTRFQHGHQMPKKNTTIQSIMHSNNSLNLQIRSFLNVVFDSFFSSLLYKQKQSILIKELSDRLFQMYQNLKLVFQSPHFLNFALQNFIQDNNFYKYLLYLVLKRISHRITQVKYRSIIEEVTGQKIKANILKQIVKILQVKEETSSFSGDSLFFVQNSGTTGSQFVKIQEKE